MVTLTLDILLILVILTELKTLELTFMSDRLDNTGYKY